MEQLKLTPEQIRDFRFFNLEDMDTVYAAYQQHCVGDNSVWHILRDSHLRLPDWYNHSLDPLSDEYLAQQNTLWKFITGIHRDYNPEIDELTLGEAEFDAAVAPGWHYNNPGTGSIADEANHYIAAGMIMKHSGIQYGQRVLEYGAGFGKASVLMARLGAIVDTVDVSEYFCNAIQRQADFFKVPLTPFKGEFGFNPRGDQKYDLIFFYECFHHCVNFKNVLPMLKQNLAPNGKIMLVGEPVVKTPDANIPYEWGFRLHAENLAIMRYRHWYELGFTERFIYRIFNEAGFNVTELTCSESPLGNGYIITHGA